MKTLTKILMLAVVATMISGFVDFPSNDLVEKTIVERVHPTDTFWEIAEHNYCYDNEKVCFEEFMYNIKHLPENKKTFFNPDGSPRMLQAGDRITFKVKVRVQKEGE